MEVRSQIKISDYQDTFENVPFFADYLIEKLEKNKLKKEDRMMLIDAVSLIYHLREHQEK